ncbi:MAG: LPS export ABC transporter periplasmic protein LptC [Alphaproteobacteria bacterium]|nr:LPS export ABC transporter periplasmic protein LptC [Alphaproteobacteria bacterium]
MTHPSENDRPHGRLDFIRPRLTRRIVRARKGRMDAFVSKLKIWLPILAVGIVILLFVSPSLRPSFSVPDIAKNIPDLVIDNLHYSGVDEKNQPYTLRAAQATKPSTLTGIYDLTKPEGEIALQSGAWIDSKADYGRYDETAKKLWLGGNVQIFHNKGYQFRTDEAQIDLNTSDAWGSKNVLIQGNFGTIRGKGFRFMDSGHTFVVDGPAKAVLETSPSKE